MMLFGEGSSIKEKVELANEAIRARVGAARAAVDEAHAVAMKVADEAIALPQSMVDEAHVLVEQKKIKVKTALSLPEQLRQSESEILALEQSLEVVDQQRDQLKAELNKRRSLAAALKEEVEQASTVEPLVSGIGKAFAAVRKVAKGELRVEEAAEAMKAAAEAARPMVETTAHTAKTLFEFPGTHASPGFGSHLPGGIRGHPQPTAPDPFEVGDGVLVVNGPRLGEVGTVAGVASGRGVTVSFEDMVSVNYKFSSVQRVAAKATTTTKAAATVTAEDESNALAEQAMVQLAAMKKEMRVQDEATKAAAAQLAAMEQETRAMEGATKAVAVAKAAAEEAAAAQAAAAEEAAAAQAAAAAEEAAAAAAVAAAAVAAAEAVAVAKAQAAEAAAAVETAAAEEAAATMALEEAAAEARARAVAETVAMEEARAAETVAAAGAAGAVAASAAVVAAEAAAAKAVAAAEAAAAEAAAAVEAAAAEEAAATMALEKAAVEARARATAEVAVVKEAAVAKAAASEATAAALTAAAAATEFVAPHVAWALRKPWELSTEVVGVAKPTEAEAKAAWLAKQEKPSWGRGTPTTTAHAAPEAATLAPAAPPEPVATSAAKLTEAEAKAAWLAKQEKPSWGNAPSTLPTATGANGFFTSVPLGTKEDELRMELFR